MNLPELCIKRPVMTVLLTLAVCLFGAMAFVKLPVNDLPNVDFPTIEVSASLPGATPETMASAVATPLEAQFSTIAGLDSMSSSSTLGNTRIVLQFRLDRNIDAAALDVQSAISAVQRRLPQDMPAPPSYRKTNPADQPIMFIAVGSKTLPLSVVNEYAETLISQRLSMLEGVSQVLIFGSQKYALRVRMDPRLLASRGITTDDIRTALAAHNVNLPSGIIDGTRQALTVYASGQLKEVTDFKDIVVAYRNNAPVRLGELASVIDSVQDNRVASWFFKDGTGSRNITLGIQRQPGANTVETVDRINALLPSLQAQLPESVSIEVLRDAAIAVRESVKDVKFTLLLAIALVILVIFLFLRTLTATVIPSIAIPMALLGTFMVMYFFDYSVDNLSLLALTLSVGFVVDDAIVMLENIVRHRESGEGTMAASLKGSREIGFTILSMTLSLVAVFIPLMFMGGILGRLLHEFAVTISAAIIVSGFVSLTLTPMLCSRFLSKTASHEKAEGNGWMERLQKLGLSLYERGLRWSLKHRWQTIASAFVAAALSALLFFHLPKGFIPTDDQGLIIASIEAPQDTSFDQMSKYLQQAGTLASANPAVAVLQASIGGLSPTTNVGRLVLRLKPRGERPPAATVVNQLRAELSKIPGIRAYPQIPPPIRLGGQQSKALYQVSLFGSDLGQLYPAAQEAEKTLRALPELTDVNSDLQITSPQLRVQIRRDQAAALGVTPQQIEDTLYTAYGSRQVSTIYTPTNQYYVILEVDREFQRTTDSVSMLYLRSKTGAMVPLSSVVELSQGVAPLSVSHLGQVPAVTISFNLAANRSLSEATEKISTLFRSSLPTGVSYDFIGTAQAFAESTKGMGLLLLMAVVVIYIVLGALYEDFIHPLTILSGLPAAGFGALATLWLFGEELNIMGYVGVILLIGIVKKNAIMMIDYAVAARHQQGAAITPEKAITDACLVRFRPIMMTTFAALAGAVPIALGLGAGADSRRSLGLAVVGGLVVSQVLTLFLTPVIYLAFESLAKRFKLRFREIPEGGP